MTKPSEIRSWTANLELRGAETDGRTLIGRVASYGRVYDVGPFAETLHPGVFSKSIAEAARSLPLLTMHDHSSIPIGKASKWEDSNDELIGHWLMDTRAEAREVQRLIAEEYLGGLSVGFNPIRSQWDASGAKPHVDRYEARLLETSLVPVQAYSDAGVLAMRSMGVPDDPATQVVHTPNLDRARAIAAQIRRTQ
jgi:HK97 family phage prohead protease